jgi:hypothetical protein
MLKIYLEAWLRVGRQGLQRRCSLFCNVPSNSALAQISTSYSANQLTTFISLRGQARDIQLLNTPLDVVVLPS